MVCVLGFNEKKISVTARRLTGRQELRRDDLARPGVEIDMQIVKETASKLVILPTPTTAIVSYFRTWDDGLKEPSIARNCQVIEDVFVVRCL